MPTSEDSEIDLSTLSKEELQQEVQRRVDAQLAKERAEIAPLPAEQQSPTIGEQSLRPTPADIPPTGNQPSPSSQGSQSFNNPTNVANIVAQAVKATAEAMSGHQGFAHTGTFRVNPGSDIDPWLGSVKKEQDLYIMFDVFRSKMVSYFQEEGVYDVLGITDVKVGKRGVDLAELRGIFGTDVVDKSLKLWNIIISKILYPPIQNLIMACESPQQGWKIVTNFYQEKKESEKTRLEQEWLALEMRESENPQDYIARSEALRLRLASVGTIKDTTHAYKDVVRGLPPSYAVQKGILLASDVVTLHALETVVRDAHMEMERERSKEQRREAELALVASGASRSGGGNGGASGGQGVVDGQDREIRDGERNRDVFVEDPTGFCRYHQSELHTNGQCRYQQHLRRTRTRAAAEDRHGGGGGGRGGGWSQRGGRPPSGAGRGGGRWAYVVYYAHDDGGYYEDYGDYDDGYYYDGGYHDAGYAHYAGGGDSYSYPSGQYVIVGDGRLLKVKAIGSINLSFFQEGSATVVPSSESVPPTGPTSVVPASESVPPAGYADVVPSSASGFECVGTFPGMDLGDTSVLTDEQLMDGYDDTPHQDFFPVFIPESDAANVAGVLDSIDGGSDFDLGAAALGPGASPFTLGSTEKSVDINRFHRSLAHACEPLLRETAQQRGIVLTGKLEPCTDCMKAKGRRGSVPRGPGARASKPLGRVHLDLCGPLVPSLGGNLYLFVAVDSASRWNKVYGLRRKSDALAATKRLLADVGRYDLGRIECFRVDNGTEWTRGDFRRFCDDNGIGVEFTPPGVPQYNGVVESAIWRIMKAGMAARRSAGRVFHVDFASIPGLDERGDRLWMESAKWAADALNQSATKANPGRRSPHEMFTGEQGPFRVLPFFQPGFMREDRRTKLDDQATLCYYLNGGDNHPSGTVKVLKASTGRVVYTNNVSWVTSAPAGEGGSAGITAAPTPPPFTPPVVSINFGPAPTPSTATPPPPAPTPSPAPASAASSTPAATPPPATTPPPAPTTSQPPSATSPSPSATPAPGNPSSASPPSPSATPDPYQPPPPPDPAMPPLTAHAMRQLRPGTKAEGMTDPRLPSRTRSGTRHSTGLISMLDRNTLVSMLEARSAVDKERRELGGAEAGEPGGTGAGEQAGALAAVDPGAAGAGFPLAFATLLANREDIDATLRDQRPPEQRPDLPHCQASDLRVPKSYKEAMASEHRHLWSDSMQREFYGLLEAGTFTPAKMLAALACELNLDLCHFDVEQAFVRSELEEDVYMRLPQGCGALSGMIVKLGKSLYGLRQASRQWHAMLKRCLVALGFEQCMADACVFRLIEDGCVVLILVVHVDDIFAVGERERCDKFGADLNKSVPVKNLGELRWYSGCFYERNKETGRLTISQQTFTDELAAEYGVVGGRSVPMSSGVKLSDFDADEVATEFPFRELVGSLMWLATQTRPDIANAVRAVARYCASPKLVHWNAAMDILGYARRTSHFGISFQRGTVEGFSLQGYADADFASKAADRRSVSGGIVTCGGGAVSWFSRTQKCVTLSTTEAEYVALGDVVKEILFLRQIWRFMLPQVGMPCIPVFEDNQGAIQLAQNPISNSNSKHIDVRHHFLRELVERKEISVIHVPSPYQRADFLTKSLPKDAFESHRDFVMNLA
ncbi:unnamed protein product [Ectocarpus sp. CCAP 1310/34]|nr:unnamed protein product [Ectocarpus sp. CCAP 1310/34]